MFLIHYINPSLERLAIINNKPLVLTTPSLYRLLKLQDNKVVIVKKLKDISQGAIYKITRV